MWEINLTSTSLLQEYIINQLKVFVDNHLKGSYSNEHLETFYKVLFVNMYGTYKDSNWA